RAPVVVVDCGADDHRARLPRAADRPADPFDAGDAAPHAGDEGDPAEVQDRQEAPAGRADEVLPGEPDQPSRVVSAACRTAAGLLRALLRSARLLKASAVGFAVVAAHRSEHRCACERALVRLPAARHLRGKPGRLDVLHVRDDGEDPAVPDDGAADLLHHFPAPVPDGTGHLLGDDEPLDRRPGSCDTAIDAEDAGGPAATTLVADAAEGRTGRRRGREGARNGPRRRSLTAAEGQAQETSAAMNEQLQIEATGETVGEAKWSALRELEKLQPGLDKAAVKFQVVSEGERGLLGVGFAPA